MGMTAASRRPLYRGLAEGEEGEERGRRRGEGGRRKGGGEGDGEKYKGRAEDTEVKAEEG